MDTIIYKSRYDKTILAEEEALESGYYDKYYYRDDKILKAESVNDGYIEKLTLYLAKWESVEEFLYPTRHIPEITIYHHNIEVNGYHYYEVENFEYLERKYHKIEVCKDHKKITQFWIYPSRLYGTNTKNLYTDFDCKYNRKCSLNVSYHESGEFKAASFGDEPTITSLRDFLAPNYLDRKYGITDKQFFISIFPVIPNHDIQLPARDTRYRDEFTNSRLTLAEALSTAYHIKEVYEGGLLTCKEWYHQGRITKRTLYFRSPEFDPEQISRNTLNKICYNPTEEHNYIVWDIVYFDGLKASRKGKEVQDYNGEKVAQHIIDNETGQLLKAKKYTRMFYDDMDGYKPFTYNKKGKICKEITTLGFDNETTYISDLKQEGFFDDEYGRYFISAEPLIPYRRGPNKEDKTIIYRNHFGKIIGETEIKHVYEYTKEEIVDGFLRDFSHHRHKSLPYSERYFDTAKTAEECREYATLKAYNLRLQKGYRLYDLRFFVEGTDGKTHYNGLLIQDAFGREVTKVLFDSEKVIVGRKTYYSDYVAGTGDTESFIRVVFDEKGIVDHYITQYTGIPETHPKNYVDSDKLYKQSQIRLPYYGSLNELLPPHTLLTNTRLYKRPLPTLGSRQGHSTWTPFNGYFTPEGKLKHVLDGSFIKKYFLSPDEEINTVSKALSHYYYMNYYFNIRHTGDVIDCSYFNPMGVMAVLKINCATYQIAANNVNDSSGTKLVKLPHEEYIYEFQNHGSHIYITDFNIIDLTHQLMLAI